MLPTLLVGRNMSGVMTYVVISQIGIFTRLGRVKIDSTAFAIWAQTFSS